MLGYFANFGSSFPTDTKECVRHNCGWWHENGCVIKSLVKSNQEPITININQSIDKETVLEVVTEAIKRNDYTLRKIIRGGAN